MKKILIAAALMLCTLTAANAQNWAIGLRGGGMASGLTVKKYLSSADLEFGVGLHYANTGLLFNGLYEFKVPIIGDNFSFYYGFGAHLGGYNTTENENKVTKLLLGVDGVAGIEYIIPGAPIALSLDYHPAINLISYIKFWLYDIGLGIKFCF